MLSLDKTKSVEELIEFVEDKDCFLSVKADGLTTSLHYINGKLIGAETRGDGVRGTECFQNVLTMKNVPKEIPYKNELIIDGEAIIGWDTFREINDKLPEDKKYKHPRNLVSGSLQLLDNKEAAVSYTHLDVYKRQELSCYNLNTKIQSLYNPKFNDGNEIEIFLEKKNDEAKKYMIRVGDKVLNTKNNYKCTNPDGDVTPVFNGNIGIVKAIEDNGY